MEQNGITYIGVTNYRNANIKFGIKDKDRMVHIACLGKSGVGKSTLLLNMALSDVRRGNGICILDPHSEIALSVIDKIPASRKQDLVYFNPADKRGVIAFNPLSNVHPKYHHLVAASLVATFKKIWTDSWGPRMEYILKYVILTLLYVPGATLLDIQPLLTDDEYRTRALIHVKDQYILNYWDDEFAKYSKVFRMETISPILNKTGIFAASEPLRACVGQKARGLWLQEIMDNRKILVCNLSKGELGEEASSLLGSMILATLQHAALHRVRIPQHDRVPFYCFIDEAHSFLTQSFVGILAECRKFRLSLFIAFQYLEQLEPRILSAIFGNVGTVISFRVGSNDALFLANEFFPVFDQNDFINLPSYSIYLKLMIDGSTSAPFSAHTLPA
jgi:DNA helicase HerA-like ATPase